MAATIDNNGDIECLCVSTGVSVGDVAQIVFRTWDDVSPPFTIKVRAPNNKTIFDRVIRDQLPTGRPMSTPPVKFNISTAGAYRIRVAELYGKGASEATITIT